MSPAAASVTVAAPAAAGYVLSAHAVAHPSSARRRAAFERRGVSIVCFRIRLGTGAGLNARPVRGLRSPCQEPSDTGRLTAAGGGAGGTRGGRAGGGPAGPPSLRAGAWAAVGAPSAAPAP